jgi:hypothetical protein
VKVELELHLKSNLRYKSRFRHFGPFVEKPMHFYWYFVKTESVGNKILRLCKAYGDFEGAKYIGYSRTLTVTVPTSETSPSQEPALRRLVSGFDSIVFFRPSSFLPFFDVHCFKISYAAAAWTFSPSTPS